ncbi:glycosyltransferase family 2 protein [Aquiflexum lacus]|uniref:glycosyltransferase family 2 protein n=1 Tax=Aquiflexum lacus TaxID=2483805 RepID=UPI0018936EDA|nr:glycosyltransferase family 2 protein [Aquiflexum lacus]
MQKAAIVILNYNGEEMLRQFLPSVVTHSIYPIIVVDNASQDDSIEFLQNEYPQIRLIKLNVNLGYVGGYNQALNQIKAEFEFYILLNSDIKVSAGWDLDLITWMGQHSNFAAIQPKILSYQNPEYFDYAGAGGGFMDSLGYPYCRGRIFSTIEKDTNQYDDPIEVDWASGACMVLRSSCFHEIGGFDERFFAHMEEIDICWRLKRKGYKIGYLGSVKIWHVGGATLSRTNPFKTHLNFRNNLLMLHNNLDRKSFFLVYVLRMGLDLIAAISFFLDGKTADSKEVFRAHLAFAQLKNKKDSYPLAPILPNVHKKTARRSILWDYYLVGKKKYRDL